MVIDPFGRGHQLRPGLGHRPLRLPLRLLHGRGHDVPAQGRSADARGARPAGTAFVDLGVRKIRLTGGEPLVRRNVMWLVGQLGRHVASGALDELTLTTNGSQLERFAGDLVASGRAPGQCLARHARSRPLRGDHPMGPVRQGDGRDRGRQERRACQVKINAVALKGVNEDELDRMVAWCGAEGFDLTLIETMPLGDIDGDRTEQYLPLSVVRARLAPSAGRCTDIPYRTGGPARYVRVEETGGRLGFITPLTHNFCESCNRVRVTCTGTMYMCLGQEDAVDLRGPLRASEGDEPVLAGDPRRDRAQAEGPRLHHRPARHNRPAVGRHMSVTGG